LEWSIDFINSIENKHMLNTTTHNIDGKKIKEYLGVVNGEMICGSSWIHILEGAVERIYSDNLPPYYEEIFSKDRNTAFERMNKKAMEMGANGVVGINLDYGVLGNTELMMISVNGTAVKF